jgi:CTP synthase (UTP-ammonia lyase)
MPATMKPALAIALVGDRDETIVAHRALPLALAAAARRLGVEVDIEWVPTDEIVGTARVERFDALWCTPGSPYRSEAGALRAIRHARERGVPFLGTCGGFQHAVLEYARDVLQWADAAHAEIEPGATRAVIAPLACALVEANEDVRLARGSRLAAAYDGATAQATYRCSYGLNPAFRSALIGGALRVVAEDEAGDVRGIELDGHPFFVAVLFQPERAALAGARVPLAEALLAAAHDRRAHATAQAQGPKRITA